MVDNGAIFLASFETSQRFSQTRSAVQPTEAFFESRTVTARERWGGVAILRADSNSSLLYLYRKISIQQRRLTVHIQTIPSNHDPHLVRDSQPNVNFFVRRPVQQPIVVFPSVRVVILGSDAGDNLSGRPVEIRRIQIIVIADGVLSSEENRQKILSRNSECLRTQSSLLKLPPVSAHAMPIACDVNQVELLGISALDRLNQPEFQDLYLVHGEMFDNYHENDNTVLIQPTSSSQKQYDSHHIKVENKEVPDTEISGFERSNKMSQPIGQPIQGDLANNEYDLRREQFYHTHSEVINEETKLYVGAKVNSSINGSTSIEFTQSVGSMSQQLYGATSSLSVSNLLSMPVDTGVKQLPPIILPNTTLPNSSDRLGLGRKKGRKKGRKRREEGKDRDDEGYNPLSDEDYFEPLDNE